MTALLPITQSISEDLAEATSALEGTYKPVESGVIFELLERYQQERHNIVSVAETINGQGGLSGALYYFNNAARARDSDCHAVPSSHFDAEAGVKALDAEYWEKALAATDVLESMPQARRSEWQEIIRTHKTPDFTRDAVVSTIIDLLSSRLRFFSERVDGVFRQLSKTHISQRPEGFTARLIITGVLNQYGSVDSEKAGYIEDLRKVIARIQGDKEPVDCYTSQMLSVLRQRFGEWVEVDGGGWRIKLFKNSNCHIEIGQDLAWRLNAVLANLYPAAIPSQLRSKPKARKRAETPLERKPLPFGAVGRIAGMERRNFLGFHSWEQRRFTDCEFVRYFKGGYSEQCAEILQLIGGVKCSENAFHWFEFDYDPAEVIDHLLLTRTIPDHISHQFFPTKDELGAAAAAEADIQPGETVLEPEAGLGGLAEHLPKDQTTCVEVSGLFTKVLAAKGFTAINADFIEWAKSAPMFDKVVSNPPFSKGRALLHVTTSASLVKPGGRLVAILPGSMRGKDLLGAGWETKWSDSFHDQFDGTGVVVAIMTATRI